MKPKTFWVGLSLTVLSVLSGCAPAMKGGSPFDPFVLSDVFDLEPLTVNPGNSLFVQVPVSPSLLPNDVRKTSLPTLRYDDIRSGAHQEISGDWLIMGEKRLPNNWNAGIRNQRLGVTYQNVVQYAESKEWNNVYSFNIVFEISVSKDTAPGKYNVLLSAGLRNSKETTPFGFVVNVQEKKESK